MNDEQAAKDTLAAAALAASDRLEAEARLARLAVKEAVVQQEQIARRVARRHNVYMVLLLAVVAVTGGWSIRSNSDRINVIQAERCERNLGEHQLWEGIIEISAKSGSQDPTLTPHEQAAVLRQLRALLDRAFPTTGCKARE